MKSQTHRSFLIAILLLHGFVAPLLAIAANPVGNGTLPPDDALEKCLPKPQSTEISTHAYGIDGHQWLTLRVTMAATNNYKLSHALAYYSQYPDIDTSYEAVGRALDLLNKKWQRSIMNNLHSLHGGNSTVIQNRRAILKEGVAHWYNLTDSKAWQVGLIIHAFGDSYAHTKGNLNTSSETAYGIPLGHAVDSILGKSPDVIKNQKAKAIEYAKQLYATIKGTSGNTSASFDAIIHEIQECEGDTCNFMKDFYDNDKEGKSIEKLGTFTACMNENSKKLTKAQVLLITDWIAAK